MLTLLLLMCTGAPAMAAPTLYDRLGQEPGIALLVDTFRVEVAADYRLRRPFVGINRARLRRCLIAFLTAKSGGPNRYECRGMRESHRRLVITSAEFDAFVMDFERAEKRRHIDLWSQRQLGRMLRSYRQQIVTHHS